MDQNQKLKISFSSMLNHSLKSHRDPVVQSGVETVSAMPASNPNQGEVMSQTGHSGATTPPTNRRKIQNNRKSIMKSVKKYGLLFYFGIFGFPVFSADYDWNRINFPGISDEEFYNRLNKAVEKQAPQALLAKGLLLLTGSTTINGKAIDPSHKPTNADKRKGLNLVGQAVKQAYPLAERVSGEISLLPEKYGLSRSDRPAGSEKSSWRYGLQFLFSSANKGEPEGLYNLSQALKDGSLQVPKELSISLRADGRLSRQRFWLPKTPPSREEALIEKWFAGRKLFVGSNENSGDSSGQTDAPLNGDRDINQRLSSIYLAWSALKGHGKAQEEMGEKLISGEEVGQDISWGVLFLIQAREKGFGEEHLDRLSLSNDPAGKFYREKFLYPSESVEAKYLKTEAGKKMTQHPLIISGPMAKEYLEKVSSVIDLAKRGLKLLESGQTKKGLQDLRDVVHKEDFPLSARFPLSVANYMTARLLSDIYLNGRYGATPSQDQGYYFLYRAVQLEESLTVRELIKDIKDGLLLNTENQVWNGASDFPQDSEDFESAFQLLALAGEENSTAGFFHATYLLERSKSYYLAEMTLQALYDNVCFKSFRKLKEGP